MAKKSGENIEKKTEGTRKSGYRMLSGVKGGGLSRSTSGDYGDVSLWSKHQQQKAQSLQKVLLDAEIVHT